MPSLVGSEMCIRDSAITGQQVSTKPSDWPYHSPSVNLHHNPTVSAKLRARGSPYYGVLQLAVCAITGQQVSTTPSDWPYHSPSVNLVPGSCQILRTGKSQDLPSQSPRIFCLARATDRPPSKSPRIFHPAKVAGSSAQPKCQYSPASQSLRIFCQDTSQNPIFVELLGNSEF